MNHLSTPIGITAEPAKPHPQMVSLQIDAIVLTYQRTKN